MRRSFESPRFPWSPSARYPAARQLARRGEARRRRQVHGDTRPTPTVTVEDAGLVPTGPAVAVQDALTAETFSPIIVGGEAPIVGSGAYPGAHRPDAKRLWSAASARRWVVGIGHDDAGPSGTSSRRRTTSSPGAHRDGDGPRSSPRHEVSGRLTGSPPTTASARLLRRARRHERAYLCTSRIRPAAARRTASSRSTRAT